MDPQTVYLIEDEVLLRDLVVETLADFPGLILVGSSGDGRDGLAECLRLKPDVVILDVRLPGLNGVEISQLVRQALPEIRLLVFSGAFNLPTVKRVLMAKVHGILEKSAGLAEMRKAIQAVAEGQTYYGPAILQCLPELLTGSGESQSLEALTAREREVLQLIGEGCSTRSVAEKLKISVRTADVHRTHVMKKLGVHNVAGLTRAAIAFGLVEPEQSL